MTPAVRRIAAAAPLAVLVCLPALAALLLTALTDVATLPLVASCALLTALVGFLFGSELGHLGQREMRVSRELVRAGARFAAVSRRAAVLEGLVDASRATASHASQASAAMFGELVRAEEGTRAHLAAELHDTVAQTLSQALAQLRSEPGHQNSPGVEAVRDAEEQLRRVMARVRPPELVDGDLARAVGDLCADLEHRYAVAVRVSWPDESVPMPGPVATTLYRFLQEMLLNAVTHADGVDVRLTVSVRHDSGRPELEAVVADGGPGFRLESVRSSQGRHVGLRLARERARLAGGS
ncbi:MAG: hypothetical protein M3N21_08210, partial [Actinomycetota bacterium]|nr:hypothetical protein [Actinomycetota bacterium]